MNDDSENRVNQKLDRIEQTMREKFEQQAVLIAGLVEKQKMSTCSAPGLCMQLEPRIRRLEDVAAKIHGGWLVLGALFTAGSVAGAVITKLISSK